MLEELDISMNINIRERKLYIGEEGSSGAIYEYENFKDLTEKIKVYLNSYYGKEIEKYENLLNIKEEVDSICEILKKQGNTRWSDPEYLKVLKSEKDILVEEIWNGLEDIPFYEEDGEQFIDEDYLDFRKGTSKEDIWHWFDERHSRGIHFLLYKYEIGKEKVEYAELDRRIPKERRDDKLFYYECRTCEGETTIERNVKVDFSKTFVTNKEILGDKEYIEEKELFENSKYKFLYDSNVHEKVINALKMSYPILDSDTYKGIYYSAIDDCDENEGGYYIEFYYMLDHDDVDFDNRLDYMVIHFDDEDEMNNPKKYIEKHIDRLLIELQDENEEELE